MMTSSTFPRPRYARIPASSKRYGLSEWEIRHKIRQKKIKAKKSGKVVLVDLDSADEHFASLPDVVYSPIIRKSEQHTA